MTWKSVQSYGFLYCRSVLIIIDVLRHWKTNDKSKIYVTSFCVILLSDYGAVCTDIMHWLLYVISLFQFSLVLHRIRVQSLKCVL
jgi:hypothetical protein